MHPFFFTTDLKILLRIATRPPMPAKYDLFSLFIHTYIDTCIHTYIHTYLPEVCFRCSYGLVQSRHIGLTRCVCYNSAIFQSYKTYIVGIKGLLSKYHSLSFFQIFTLNTSALNNRFYSVI